MSDRGINALMQTINDLGAARGEIARLQAENATLKGENNRLAAVATAAMKEREEKAVCVQLDDFDGKFNLIVTYPGHDEGNMAKFIAEFLAFALAAGEGKS